jgi:hypothetical protein
VVDENLAIEHEVQNQAPDVRVSFLAAIVSQSGVGGHPARLY